jgi:hypothetical protein
MFDREAEDAEDKTLPATKEEADFIRKHEKDALLGKPDWSKLPPPTAEEAADLIRPHWGTVAHPMSPEDTHRMLFVADVCRDLGFDPTPANCLHVDHLMGRMGIPVPSGHEYPKALNTTDKLGRTVPAKYPVGHEKAGQDVVFADADEEAAFGKTDKAAPGMPGDVHDVNVEHDAHVAVHDVPVVTPPPS